METLINLYTDLKEIAKMVQQRMKRYYNAKRSKGPDLKEGDKVQLLYKIFKSRQLSKKLDYIRLGPFEIIKRVLLVIYKLNLSAKIRIYPIQHIAILEPAYRDIKPPVYKQDIYRGQEEDKWQVLKIISYKDINSKTWYKVKQIGYSETTQELLSNLENVIGKVQKYQRKVGQVVLIKRDY